MISIKQKEVVEVPKATPSSNSQFRILYIRTPKGNSEKTTRGILKKLGHHLKQIYSTTILVGNREFILIKIEVKEESLAEVADRIEKSSNWCVFSSEEGNAILKLPRVVRESLN